LTKKPMGKKMEWNPGWGGKRNTCQKKARGRGGESRVDGVLMSYERKKASAHPTQLGKIIYVTRRK